MINDVFHGRGGGSTWSAASVKARHWVHHGCLIFKKKLLDRRREAEDRRSGREPVRRTSIEMMVEYRGLSGSACVQ